MVKAALRGGYDPRVTAIGEEHYITWCNDFHGPTIGLTWTTDFKKFHQMEDVFIPHSRNGVLFPEQISHAPLSAANLPKKALEPHVEKWRCCRRSAALPHFRR